MPSLRSLKILAASAVIAQPVWAQDPSARLSFPISTFGTPGLIDMPTGLPFSDGTLALSTAFHDGSQRYTLSFQIAPRVFGTFRYAIIDNFDGTGGARYDRSFDFGYLISEETDARPSVMLGLRDFGGTGVYGSEYIAASKHFLDDRLLVTGGIGWGRLGSFGGFQNPLSAISGHFDTRTESIGEGGDTGQFDIDQWFSGDAALFGGIAYQINPRLSFALEYSSDDYAQEVRNTGFKHKTPFNAMLSYGFKNGAQLSAYALHGAQFGVSAVLPIDPAKPNSGSGIEDAPPALLPRQTAAALSWSNNTIQKNQAMLKRALADEGISLEALAIDGTEATLRVVNQRYGAQAQALGRTARVLANNLPAPIETFHIVSSGTAGLPTSKTTLRRNDLEQLEYDLDGSWRSFARADITDAASTSQALGDISHPKFRWSLTPYVEPALFDPDQPVRADYGITASAEFEPMRGLLLSSIMRQPLGGDLDTSTRVSNSVLPHVRSDAVEYAKQSDFQIKQLAAHYLFRPAENLYARASVGYFGTMYGGISGELLWKPVNSALALGVELNHVKKRDFDQLLGFQNYEINTGHLSAYYDFGGGYLGQLDVGRYLAGDYGATVSLDREFGNGFRIGAFATLTDVPFDAFGEGSFDKGIRFTVPTSWLSGMPGKHGFSTTIRPVLRDGGARVDVPYRLYEMVRPTHSTELKERWGRFWR